MRDFEFYSPTKVVFGRGAEQKTAEQIKAFGGSRVFVVYGGGSVERSGLLARVKEQLAQAGLESSYMGGVQPNPLLSLARDGVKNAVAFGADFVLGVGGGSVIDTAKAVALGAANPDVDIWEFWMQRETPRGALPTGSILTISAAGSETSQSTVLTRDDTREKRGLNSEFNRPKFAIMDPALTQTLPRYQIACGVADILMHTLDRYFTSALGNELTDQIAESVLRVAVQYGPMYLENPADYDAASEVMWAGSLSHNNLTGLGAELDFSTHQLGHELSGMFDVAHGASLTTMWGAWARYVVGANPARFARLGNKLFGLEGFSSTEQAANAAIERMEKFFALIGMPTNFSQLGIGVQPDDVIEQLALGCSRGKTRTLGSFRPIDHDDIRAIYMAANK